MGLVPAYGRDYKSKAAVLADFNANKDFVISDMFGGNCGRLCNKQDLVGKERSVSIRYNGERSVAVVKL